jgi:hypothetical protein
VDIRYSDHCFTREPKPGERYEESQIYKNGERKVRLFNPKRYELSKMLPDLIRGLPYRKPQHNGTNGNFFIVEALDHEGAPVTYVIIFSLRKSTKGRMAMLVETAFFDEPELGRPLPKGRRVSFWIILNNTKNNLKIRL